MKKVLVTGGLGFVGTNLVKRLVSEEYEVSVIDNLSAGDLRNEVPGVTYYEMHTKELSHHFQKFDVVFHLGEYSKIAPSFEEIQKVWDFNIAGSFNILEYCRKNNIPIVYSGSSTKFASEGADHSPYSFAKATIVNLIKNYSKWYDLKFSICYFYNAYGPHQDTCNNGWETVISIFEKQVRVGKPLTICGDGLQKRDFTYVGDIVEGLMLAAKKLENDEYQLGSGQDYSILEVAQMFSNDIIHITERPGDRRGGLANSEETRRKLGWVPKMNLQTWIKSLNL